MKGWYGEIEYEIYKVEVENEKDNEKEERLVKV